MMDLFQKGGWVMIPILAGSVIGLGLFFERLWMLQRKFINPSDILQHLLGLVQSARWGEARVVCQRVNNPLTRVALAMLSMREKTNNRDAISAVAEEAGQREAFFLERGVGALGVVASLEPLMGLLGTVLGMIKAFRQVEIGGVGDPRLVAGGVWAALVTTAVGLAIAIPAYIGYRYLLSRVDRKVLDLQGDSAALLDAMLLAPSPQTAPQATSGYTPGFASGSGSEQAPGLNSTSTPGVAPNPRPAPSPASSASMHPVSPSQSILLRPKEDDGGES